MKAVEFDRVSKHYGSVRAVDEVSLAVEPGAFTTILGPSGSGKTTMLSLIAGIVQPTAGRIAIGGRDVTFTAARDRNVGLVFQSYALFPHMNVFDNIAFPLRVRGRSAAEVAQRVEEALATVRLSGLEQRKPNQLSGGQQQRVALARAIVFKPEILLLDEPLAALDRKLREEVRIEIRRLQRGLGITTVLVTHDQDEALSLSDNVVVLHQGRVQQTATPSEMYHRPQNRFVADFLGIANFLEGQVASNQAIRLESGELAPCASAGAGRVVGVLRPERIRLVNGDGRQVGIPGRISETVFLGESVRYSVTLDSGFTLIAQSSETRKHYAEGMRVTVDWDPASVWVLPQPEAGGGQQGE
jgi:ABC-type Fe3+/spermidine/putrescine transport system ATPase subunit